MDIDGVPASPIEGEGYDVGLKFNFLGGKLQGSIDKFSTTQKNVVDGTVAGRKRTAINDIWNTIDLSRVPNPQWNEFQTTETEGYEFQVVGNPTSNLRLMLTASQNITTVADRGAKLFAFIDRNLPEWQAQRQPAGQLDAGRDRGQPGHAHHDRGRERQAYHRHSADALERMPVQRGRPLPL